MTHSRCEQEAGNARLSDPRNDKGGVFVISDFLTGGTLALQPDDIVCGIRSTYGGRSVCHRGSCLGSLFEVRAPQEGKRRIARIYEGRYVGLLKLNSKRGEILLRTSADGVDQ